MRTTDKDAEFSAGDRHGMDRRAFLSASAIAGMGLASAGLLGGCASSNTKAAAAEEEKWDKEVDVLVVGSGGASWGALAAKDAGAESVLIIEKSEAFGGTTALSEGITWVPVNYVMAKEGIEDNRADALKYISTISLGYSTQELMEAYVDNGPKFLEWARDTWGFVWERQYDWINQDYYQVEGFRPRGRSVNVNPVDSTKAVMGEDFKRPEKPSNGQTFVIIKYLCEKHGIEIMLSTEGKKLIKNSEGRVVGLVATKDGKELRISAKKGILLGTGGFDFNDEMRREYLHYPFFASRHIVTNTGDGQRMGQEVGAALANMAHVYGQCCLLPQGEYEGMQRTPEWTVTDSYQFRGKPGAVVVNRYGKRIGNESTVYANFQRCMEGWDPATFKPLNVPAFWICGSTFTDRYMMPGAKAVGEVPSWITTADSLEELATKLGIDSAGLAKEIGEFNKNAADGVDPVWHRGEFSHDQRSVADSTRDDLKNKCLAPVEKAPFYGAKYYPASLGTAGGLKINGKAQVLDVNGEVIPGLFACGCAACSPYGAGYAGGGAPVGASSVMGWVAGTEAIKG
ncbi:MAG: FAD-binding protein [Coriobacteriia bacterium]